MTLPVSAIRDACADGRDSSFGSLRGHALSAVALLLSACGGTSSTSGTNPDDGSVWTANATQVVATDDGAGFGPGPVPGSACPYAGAGTYTMTVADRKLAWQLCVGSQPGGGNQLTMDQRVLSEAEFQSVVSALQQITVSKATSCGADKSHQTLQVTLPSGAHTYLDSFYACEQKGTYVDNISDAFSAFHALVP